MWESLKELLNAFGGRAAVLLALGSLVTCILNFRTSRNLERFKADKQKELNQHLIVQSKRKELADKLYGKCDELRRATNLLVSLREMYGVPVMNSLHVHYDEQLDKVLHLAIMIDRYCLPLKLYGPPTVLEAIKAFTTNSITILGTEVYQTKINIEALQDMTDSKLQIIEKMFREMLGSDKL